MTVWHMLQNCLSVPSSMCSGFLCKDGGCILPQFECDYFADCYDSSDEHSDCIDNSSKGSGQKLKSAILLTISSIILQAAKE